LTDGLPPGSSRNQKGGSRKKKTDVKHMNLGNDLGIS